VGAGLAREKARKIRLQGKLPQVGRGALDWVGEIFYFKGFGMKRFVGSAVGAVLLVTGGTAVAEEQAFRLEPIQVTAPGLVRDAQATPAAVGVVQQEDLEQGRQQLQLDESLNRIPGVFFQNRYNFAQNLRLSIRGFGARAPFGIRGVRLRVDEIPETLPDGQSQVDAIDLESADQVEVIRGPSSALYGNAAGGVVDIRTRSGPPEPYIQGRATAGSYGFRRYGVMGGGENGPWNGHVSAWHMNYDGYRDQSETEKMLLNTKGRYRFSPERELTTVFTAYDQPKGQDPGGLTREEVREDRRQAGGQAEDVDAGQTVEQQRLGFIYRDQALLPGELKLRTFYTRRDFQQQLPSSAFPSSIAFTRDYYGIGADYTDSGALLGVPLNYTVGTEASEQRDQRERFNVDAQGNQEDQTQDATEVGTAAGVFGQVDLFFTERLTLTLGGRYDYLRLKVRDRRDGGEASGRETFNELSLSLGPAYRIHLDHQLYANIGTSFESPTFTEFYDPTDEDTGFDPGLGPQQALNAEVGIKGLLGERTRYDLALFQVRTDDEIIVVASEDGQSIFGNAGETRRYGVELGVEHFLTESVTLSGAYTWSDFRYRDYQPEDADNLRGNRLPGLPEHSLFAELAWRDGGGWYAMVDSLLVSSVYADDESEERVAGYAVVNTRLGRTMQLGGAELETFVALNNLLDKDYFSNIRVNANFGRYFEPAPERNLYAGLRLTF